MKLIQIIAFIKNSISANSLKKKSEKERMIHDLIVGQVRAGKAKSYVIPRETNK